MLQPKSSFFDAKPKASGAVKRGLDTSSSLIEQAGDEAEPRPDILSVDHGNGLMSFTAGTGLGSFSKLAIGIASPLPSRKKRNIQLTPPRKIQGPSIKDKENFIGAIEIIHHVTLFEEGTHHWTNISAKPKRQINITVPFAEIGLYVLLLEINYQAMSTLTLDDSLEGQKGRQTLLRHFRPLDKSYYDQDVLDYFRRIIEQHHKQSSLAISSLQAANELTGQSIADLRGFAGGMVDMQAMLQILLAYNERNTSSSTQL